MSENGKIFTRGGSTELGSIDTPDTFNYDLSSKKVRIVWHFDAAGEARTFTVAYRFRGLAVAYDDVVDVNLRVWGSNWSSPLGELAASITLPRPAALTPSYRVWGHPPSVNGVVTRTRPAALLRAVNIPSNQWVEMRVVFPRAAADLDRGREGRGGQRPGADRQEGGRRRGRLPARPRPARGREAARRPDAPLPPPASASARRS